MGRPWQVKAFLRSCGRVLWPEQVVDVEQAPGLEIPDVGTPVVSSIDIAQQGTINDLRIKVNISHTYIGDLRVDLVAPDGTAVVLHNNAGGSADDLIKTYSIQETRIGRSRQAVREAGRVA